MNNGKIWKFLNSGVGLWLLTSVMVGAFTAAYTYITEGIAEKKEKAAVVKSLDLEIESRLSQFLVQCKTYVAHPYDTPCFTFHDSSDILMVKRLWYNFKDAPSATKYFYALNPAYVNRNVASLVAELSTLVKEQERERLRDVLATIIDDGVFFGVSVKERCFSVFWNRFKTEMLLGRWDTIMPYVDCRNDPFC